MGRACGLTAKTATSPEPKVNTGHKRRRCLFSAPWSTPLFAWVKCAGGPAAAGRWGAWAVPGRAGGNEGRVGGGQVNVCCWQSWCCAPRAVLGGVCGAQALWVGVKCMCARPGNIQPDFWGVLCAKQGRVCAAGDAAGRGLTVLDCTLSVNSNACCCCFDTVFRRSVQNVHCPFLGLG